MKNFIVRAITGVLFVVILVGCTLYSELTFLALFAIITMLTVREFCRLLASCNRAEINTPISCLAAGVLFIAFAEWVRNGDIRFFLPFLLLMFYIGISELYLKKRDPLINLACSALLQAYIAIPFALLSILAYKRGTEVNETIYVPWLPLAVFVFIWLNDTGAYCVGSLIGKHRLFERISPKKSWEGSVGGLILSVVSSLFFAHYFPAMNVWEWMGLAAVVVVFGTWGDLTESLLKRQLGIKDSGSILPGHGGFLDRFDSALFAIPAAVVYLFLLQQ